MPDRFQGKPSRARADAELALRQVDRLDPRLQRQAERAEAMLGIDAVAIEFAGAAGGENQRVAEEDDEPERIVGGAGARADRDEADCAPRRALVDENARRRPCG